ncbi:hypothetical protein AVL62_03945 [Serinicoccus chungangensis]|uniref:ABC transporter permease n=1 Tax=Serinicoccus chungangensis TaxID=767452 RepID=A0A0W8I6Z2_9MICO|nr:hypothetical protein [Serinicoccus chungangensis]KUG54377.1 hypothetical protein AVL62_03945 [Serinicoccus chungangensis]
MPRRRPLLLLSGVLLVSAVLLLGPWWETAAGDNPLTRPPGPDYAVVLRLSLPTLVLAATVVALLVTSRGERGEVGDRQGRGGQH